MPKRTRTTHPRIFQYADGTYYYRASDDEFSLKTKDWKEALLKAQVEDYKREKTAVGSRKLRIMDVIDDYKADRKSEIVTDKSRRRGIRKSTYKEIEDLFELHLTPYFGSKKLYDVNEAMWNGFCKHCRVNDMSNLRKVFRTFLEWCRMKEYIVYVPHFKIPQVIRRRRRILRPHEIKSLFANAKGDLLLFVAMGILMGLRPGEIRQLTWERLNLEGGSLLLNERDTKTNKARSIPLNSFVWSLLKAREKTSRYVLPHRDRPNEPFNKFWPRTSWQRLLTRAKLADVTPNDMRSTYEKYSNMRTDFTDTQREKFSGASIDVQKRIYVQMDADDLRGLEEVVQVDGLAELLSTKLLTTGKQRGANEGKISNT